jgi:hypothetical protein
MTNIRFMEPPCEWNMKDEVAFGDHPGEGKLALDE